MKYVLLGGGCSFAIHTAKHLIEAGHDVVSVGRSPQKDKVFTLGVPLNWWKRDVRNIDLLVYFLDKAKPDVIVNFAAEGESSASFVNSWRYFDMNCTVLSRLVERIKDLDYLQRFIQIGASEVYGNCDGPARESDKLNPTSPYAASKAAFDQYLMAMARKGFRCNIIRPSNTYGEGQQLHRIIPKAILFGLTGRRIPLYGSGTGRKSYLHASDLARAIEIVAAKAPLSRIYNVAPRMPISTRDLVCKIAKLLDMPEPRLFQDQGLRKGTDATYWFDTAEIERLGWSQQVTLDEGLVRVLDWVKANLETLAPLPIEYQERAA